jgi:outer membrane receptor for ferrienterochelin and colicin
MRNKNRFFQSSVFALLRGGLTATFAVALILFSVASNAQEITTTVRGTVSAPDGAPAVGETVTVTDTRTSASRTVTTNNSGAFTVRGLPVGGPFTIRVQSSQYQGTMVTDVYTNLSSAASFDITLGVADETIEEIVTTARMVATADMAIGPGSAYSLEEIESMPSIARQIRDVVRIDPRVQIGRSANGSGSGIQCMGGTARNNAMTIDGTIASDGFGLNAGTGTSVRFAMPIPYDTIASAAVEFAPLDVQYSQFTGCAVNIVTKPGSNEFHGSGFYLYNDESSTGHDLGDDTVITAPFEDKNFGFDLSGPIIKDKLFFTVAYEKTDDVDTMNTGPDGGGFGTEVSFIDVATAEAIADVIRTRYDRDPGFIVRNLPQETERVFVRLDWNINDEHRAEMTYTDLDELNLDPDDCCQGFDGFTMSDNFELEGIQQDTLSLRLFSNWTDNFSTEFRYSTFDVTDIQGPLGGGEAQDSNPISRIVVEDGTGTSIFMSGPGFSRSANDLQYTIDQFKLSADWVFGDHTLTVGFEQESRDIFNLFIQNATGTIHFADIAALQAGLSNEFEINGSFTGDPSDAAALFGRDVNSYYVQDEWRVNDAVTVTAGVRFDEYSSSDRPVANPVFEQRYGFSNQQTFDGLDLVQPRLGFTWDLPTSNFGSTQLSAGFGIFGGGDPTVHFANSYQNFGGAQAFADEGFDPCNDDPANFQVITGGVFTGLPNCVNIAAAAAATANLGGTAVVDPKYELPSNERWSLGFGHLVSSGIGFLDGWDIRADYIYTDHKNAIEWVDLRLTPNGVILPDGRPQFFEVDPLQAGCAATFNGIGQGFSGAGTNGGPCDDVRNSNQDILMTNGVEGSTTSISLQLAKTFDYSDKTSLDLSIGYANLDSEVGNPITSFTAGSSYENSAKAIINDQQLGPSMWASEHNIVLSARFKHYWNDTNATAVNLFFNRRSGRPFSYTYEDDTGEDLFGDTDDEESILLYVPTGPSDPRMDFTTNLGNRFDQADVDAFFAFLQSSGLNKYAGSVTPKNAFTGPWHSDLDIRIQQDIGLFEDHQVQIFFDIENALNLILGDDDNIRRYNNTGDIPEGIPVLQLDDGVTGVYEVEDIFDFDGYDGPENDFSRDVDDSVYRIQLGIRYRF